MYYVSIEDTYDVVRRAHLSTGHGGRDRMLKELGKKHANVTRDALELYKSYCQECQKKRKRPMTKGVVQWRSQGGPAGARPRLEKLWPP